MLRYILSVYPIKLLIFVDSLKLLLVELSSRDIVRYRACVCVSWCLLCAFLLRAPQDHGDIWIELVSAYSYTRSSPGTL